MEFDPRLSKGWEKGLVVGVEWGVVVGGGCRVVNHRLLGTALVSRQNLL